MDVLEDVEFEFGDQELHIVAVHTWMEEHEELSSPLLPSNVAVLVQTLWHQILQNIIHPTSPRWRIMYVNLAYDFLDLLVAFVPYLLGK
jgi:hypothetical protein